MTLFYELQVFKDVFTLVQKVFFYTQDFPPEYKYTLGQEIKREAIQLVRSIYRANKSKETTNARGFYVRRGDPISFLAG